MFGITGIMLSKASDYIRKMTDVLVHRGPDDTGIFINHNVAFGHQKKNPY
jgi:asparagine synthetase B (glutamine-hydrolysing)